MLESFIAWLDDFTDEKGVAGLCGGALGLLAFGTIMSAVLGDLAIKTAVVVATFLIVLGVFAVLVRDRRAQISRLRRAQRLLVRYTRIHDGGGEPMWRTLTWENRTEIFPNGLTTEIVSVAILVNSPEMRCFRIMNGAGRELTDRQKRAVKVEVMSLTALKGPGPRWETTSSWRSDDRLEIIAHCSQEVQRGQIVNVLLRYRWPRKCTPLMRGDCAEDFALYFRTPIEKFVYEVTIHGRKPTSSEPINDGAPDAFTLAEEKVASNKIKYTLTAEGIPAGERVGMRLDVAK